MVAQTRGGPSSPKKLAFRDKLIGKGLTTDSLQKKLKALHLELSALDQELVDVQSLGSVRKELINISILLHKDKGVKAYAACCLADILRLYAPDAPYTQSELRDIFQFFFRQLTNGLKGQQETYYNEYFHLLESLATVQSVVLVCDLPSMDEIMLEIFRTCFAIIRRDLAKKIEIFMGDILTSLIDEAPTLSSEVVESIMAQFMDKDPRIEQPAYRLAVHVSNATSDKLQRHVCQYVTDIITENPSEPDYDEIHKTHDLIKRINHSAPNLLQSVVPILEEELRTMDVQIRQEATQTLGEMFGDKGGADMVKKYPSAWTAWLARKNDKASSVRLKFVEATRGLLNNHVDLRDTIEDILKTKLFDPDDKVRTAVCKLYSQMDYETALHHVSLEQLQAIAERGADKKASVRSEALNCVGRLYNLAHPEIESNDPAAIRQFAWIPSTIITMEAYKEAKTAVEQVIFEHIYPLPTATTAKNGGTNDVDETAWTDRLLVTMRYLDTNTVEKLLRISGLKSKRPTLYESFVEACISNNGGVIDDDEDAIKQRLAILVKAVAASFPEDSKAEEHLNTFAKLNEARLYRLLKTCMDLQSDIKSTTKASAEFIRRITDQSPAIASTMTTLLRRASARILNQSSIPTLIRRVRISNAKNINNASMASMASITSTAAATTQAEMTAQHAHALLRSISKFSPALYRPHMGELTKAIADEKHPDLVGAALHALAAMVQIDNKLAPSDKRTAERLRRYVMESEAVYAKSAARILAFSKNAEAVCTAIVDSIADGLEDADPELLVAHLTVLVQFTKFAPEAFEIHSEVIMSFVMNKVLMAPCPKEDDVPADTEWIEDEQVTLIMRAKLLALKLCRNRSLAHANSDSALEMATPVLRMMVTVLEHHGSMTADANEDPRLQSRMRLLAAVSLLRLSMINTYWMALTPKFMTIAITIQDSCFHVRHTFLQKLGIINLPSIKKLPACFNVIPMVTVHDPESDTKELAKGYFSFMSRHSQWKKDYLEMVFIHFLHFLARHPDYGTSLEEMQDAAEDINFYLEHICTHENVGLLYMLAGKGKTVRDAQSDAYNENLYVMCELAQELIKLFATAHSWTIDAYPGKITLPRDIFRAYATAEAANKVGKKVYLPQETISWLEELGKPNSVKKQEKRKAATKRRRPASDDKPPKRARKGRKSKSKKNYDDGSDEDESDKDVDPSSDVNMSAVPSEAEEEPVVNEGLADEPQLGRGARSRAAKKKQSLKARKPAKVDANNNDGDETMDE